MHVIERARMCVCVILKDSIQIVEMYMSTTDILYKLIIDKHFDCKINDFYDTEN